MIIRNFFITLVVFLGVDMIWLGIVARKLYSDKLGYIMTSSPKWWAAILFYLVFVIGIQFFVLYPALEKQQLLYALLTGMFFGFVTYATYDLTNLATLKDWPLLITVIDLIWGTALGGLTTLLSYVIIRFIDR